VGDGDATVGMGVILPVRGLACQVARVCHRDSPVEGEVMAPGTKVLPDYVVQAMVKISILKLGFLKKKIMTWYEDLVLSGANKKFLATWYNLVLN
jgi:hypothetical protein